MNRFSILPTKQNNTSSTLNKKPFAATRFGIAVNTITGIPKAAREVVKDIGQGIARSVGTVGTTVGNVPTQISNAILPPKYKQPLPFQGEIDTTGNKITRTLFGGKPIRTLPNQITKTREDIAPFIGKKASRFFAPPLVVGSLLLDLSGFGGKAGVKSFTSGEIPEQFFKYVAKEADEGAISKTLKSIGLDEARSSELAKKLAPTKTADEAKTVLAEFGKNETQKTPLEVTLPKKKEIVAPLIENTGEARSLEKIAQEGKTKDAIENNKYIQSLNDIISNHTPLVNKVNILDYFRTPDRVLKKIGLENEMDYLRQQNEKYVLELPKNIEKITEWSKRVPKESNQRIFDYLDNKNVDLNPKELEVAGEIKTWLAQWADRLGLPQDNRIAEYITHIFDKELLNKEFDEDLAKIISDKIPSEVYNPFLEKRLGKQGYIRDTWRALDAYVKRATRKVYMDDALAKIEEASGRLEKSQWDYVKQYVDRINMRPTDLDNILDNGIKQIAGYKFGQRPTSVASKKLRQIAFRGMIGLNVSSALRNLSQGVNTYATLGEKYTTLGYFNLLKKGFKELEEQGILANNIVQDRTLSATKKKIEAIDKGLFFLFDTVEKINKGAAFYGAKAKFMAQGMGELNAIKKAKEVVRKTQFQYGAIDTPVSNILSSDIGKVFFQFANYPFKQTEFLTELAKDKNYAGLARYVLAGLVFIYTIGKTFNMKPDELIPFSGYFKGTAKFGQPPSLKMPLEVIKAILDTPNKYGVKRTLSQKGKDILKAGVGIIPAGTQIKKTVEGIKAIKEGGVFDKSGRKLYEQKSDLGNRTKATLFGKYSTKEASEYYKKRSLPKKSKNKDSKNKTIKSSNRFSL